MREAPENCDSGVWAKLKADIIRTPRRVPMGPRNLYNLYNLLNNILAECRSRRSRERL
jgi:hypothetical protein